MGNDAAAFAWVVLLAGILLSEGCPRKCTCPIKYYAVYCEDTGMTAVPDGIPSDTRLLSLHNNNITVIMKDQFKHLVELETLQMSQNKISDIEVGAFTGLDALKTLELYYNRLEKVPSTAFAYLPNLRELWLRGNPIKRINSWAFVHVPTLTYLDIGELKDLEFISDNAFLGLTKLRYLNMGVTNLKKMPGIRHLTNLEELDLSGNPIAVIEADHFQSLRNLRKLWLTYMQINTVEMNALDELVSLYELNLSYNNLTMLPYNLFSPLPNLQKVFLHHNPWRCHCEILWLSQWLRDNIPSNRSCNPCAQCAFPDELRGTYIGDVYDSNFTCAVPIIENHSRDLNITEGSNAELRCTSGRETAISWITPNGTTVTHGSYKVKVKVLSDGTLNISSVTVSDSGKYICVAENPVGNATISVVLTVNGTGNISFTVTNKTMPGTESSFNMPTDSAKPKSPQSTPPILNEPDSEAGTNGSPKVDDVIVTTKIIIGCFGAITLAAICLLIVYYRMQRKKKKKPKPQNRSYYKTVDLVNIDELCPDSPNSMGKSINTTSNSLNTHTSLSMNNMSTFTSLHTLPHENSSQTLPRDGTMHSITKDGLLHNLSDKAISTYNTYATLPREPTTESITETQL
ncbi:leucine-rich repeat-containing protein 4C-like [Branchiostoma lanceolatum]|uniref:LRRC4C protein n=1 Tax=Branchiostoma lanceolatum TaxID=7740 RepID=A0A8K0EGZ4_BRALA|nr:LRRC4C [Branchiostoma lanceolatum]